MEIMVKYGRENSSIFQNIYVHDTGLDETPYRVAIHRLEGSMTAYLTREQLIELRAGIADVLLGNEEKAVKDDEEKITL